MLRYADYIDSASNLYEVPRPPRRGSHRPEAPALSGDRCWTNAPLPSLSRRAASTLPMPFLVQCSATPLTSSHLGKRSMTTASPSRTKDALKVADVDRSAATARASFVAFLQDSRGSHRDSSAPKHRDEPHAKRFCDDPRSSLGSSLSDLELLPTRCPTKPKRAQDPSASPALLNLVSQMEARRNGGRFSPTASILESYAKTIPLSASCQTVQKRCMYPDCTKISVSRGLCRGHGGGRRCHFLGCSKSAQSRSNFCWAHGGGQRCDAPDCMRSRKSKRFCVAHIQLENLSQEQQPLLSCKQEAPALQRYLPSLGQALSSASRSPPNLPGRFTV